VFHKNEPITAAARTAAYSMTNVSLIYSLLPPLGKLVAILTYCYRDKLQFGAFKSFPEIDEG